MSEGVRKVSSWMVEASIFTTEFFFPGKNNVYMALAANFLLSSESTCSLLTSLNTHYHYYIILF